MIKIKKDIRKYDTLYGKRISMSEQTYNRLSVHSIKTLIFIIGFFFSLGILIGQLL
jgi:hypothetical protein